MPRAEPGASEAAGPKSWWRRLSDGMRRTSSSIGESVTGLLTKRKLDSSTLEELEDVLVRADLGVETATRIAAAIGEGRYDKEISTEEVKRILAGEVEKALAPVAMPLAIDRAKKPFVLLMIGVNGSGKTTTIGKLARKLKAAGPERDDRRRRHLPGGGDRAAQGLGRARRRPGGRARARRRRRRRRLRGARAGKGARRRRR